MTACSPRVVDAFANEATDIEIFRELGSLGLLGPTIPTEYGGAGAPYVGYGLTAREIERIDSGYRSMFSVQSSPVMHPILAYGTEAQKRRYLPKLASGEWIGCFGLTEPEAGSNPSQMRTRAERIDGGYRLTGGKTWISNAPVADVLIIRARCSETNAIRGFVVDRDTQGLSTSKIEGKLILQALSGGGLPAGFGLYVGQESDLLHDEIGFAPLTHNEDRRVAGLRISFLGIVLDILLDQGAAAQILARDDPHYRPVILDFEGAKRTSRLIFTRTDQRRTAKRLGFRMDWVPKGSKAAEGLKERWERKQFERRPRPQPTAR